MLVEVALGPETQTNRDVYRLVCASLALQGRVTTSDIAGLVPPEER